MSLISIILKGLAIGFLAAAPTGPSGVLVIERTLDKGRRYGFLTGLGISLSDTVYILCSCLGLSFLMNLINDSNTSRLCSIIGCMLLLAFGIYIIGNNPLKKLRSPQKTGKTGAFAYLSGFLVAIVNPMVIVIYISLMAYFNLAVSGSGGCVMAVGLISLIVGDIAWWAFISYLIDKIRNRFDLRGIWVINRILGGILIAASFVWLVFILVKG